MEIPMVSLRCLRAVMCRGLALPLVWLCFAVALAEHNPVEIRGSPQQYALIDGMYRPTSDLVNGHVAYKKEAEGLWICMDTNGFWSVQPTVQKGSTDGYMISSELGKAGPEDVSTWRLWINGEWRQITSVEVDVAPVENKVTHGNDEGAVALGRAMAPAPPAPPPPAAATPAPAPPAPAPPAPVPAPPAPAPPAPARTAIAPAPPAPALAPLRAAQAAAPAPAPATAAAKEAVLSKTYWGNLTTGQGNETTVRPMKFKLVNAKKAFITDAGVQHTVSISSPNEESVVFTDMDLAFELKGRVDAASNMNGLVMIKNKKAGTWMLEPGDAPIGSFTPSPLGRRFFMVACVCIALMVAFYSYATHHGLVYVRMYMHKVVGSACTMIVGMLIAQCMTGCFFAIPNHVPNFGIQAAVLITIFTIGWVAVTHTGWMAQKNPRVRTFLTMVGADILGFLGFYAFEALWKYITDLFHDQPHGLFWGPGSQGTIGAAMVSFAISVLYVLLLINITEGQRTGKLQEEPAFETQKRMEKIEKRAAKNSSAAQARTCGPAVTKVRACEANWNPWHEEPEVKPEAVGLKPNNTWQGDVKHVENITFSIMEAFMVFKILKLITYMEHAWWGMIIAVGLVIVMVAVAVKMSADNVVTRFEHVYTSTLALVLGLMGVDLISSAVKWATGATYMIAPMVTVLVVFVVAVIVIEIIGQYLHKKYPEQETEEMPGILTVTAKDSFAGKEPQEVAGLGLMIAVATTNVIDMVLGEIVDNFTFTQHFPLITKVLVAALFAVFMVYFWHTQILPKVSKTRKQHEEDARQSNKNSTDIEVAEDLDENEPLTMPA